MEITWKQTTQIEAHRLLYTARQIANNFYQINGFPVVSEWRAGLPQNAVIFPSLDYHSIPRFWDKVKIISIDSIPVKAPQHLIDKVVSLLPNEKVEFTKLKESWLSVQSVILQEINRVIPEFKQVEKITIMPTNSGTICSFNRFNPQEKILAIHLRVLDGGIGKITEAILSAFTRTHVYTKLRGTWSESEAVVDWLLTQSSLSNFINKHDPAYSPTLQVNRGREMTVLHKQSRRYLSNLGVPDSKPLLVIKDGTIAYGETLFRNLTPKEDRVLQKLINKKIITTDQLAGMIFPEEEDFSLYAIAKFIQRLRKKLEKNGLTGSYIQTVRGFGYRLAL